MRKPLFIFSHLVLGFAASPRIMRNGVTCALWDEAMLLRLFLLFAPAFALSACAIPNSASNAVVVTDAQAVVETCKRIGDTNGDVGVNQALLLDRARDSALGRLKIRAAEAGGTHVLSSVADPKWKGPGTDGVIYKCG
jgi:hypothetical protein